jgi:predicted ArsR family transcriptional regulator
MNRARAHAGQPAPGGRRTQVLQVLRTLARPVSITEVADRLGIHPNTARFHLAALTETGQVARTEDDRPIPGRPAQLFQAIRRMDPSGPRDYRLLAEVLAQYLTDDPDPTRRAIEAGRAWGLQRATERGGQPEEKPGAPIEELISLLENLGFSPDRDVDSSPGPSGRIDLRACPFLELATSHPQIACSVHLGLMQGALHTWRSPVTVERLEPFAEPDRCRIHLSRSTGRRRR